MKTFCIASPHKNVLWYDYRLYVNLKHELQSLGYQYRAASNNRIYFLGAPQRHFYPEVGKFDANANNIALIYCHSEKLTSISQFNKVFVPSKGVKHLLMKRALWSGDMFKKKKRFTSSQDIEIIGPFSSLTPTSNTAPRYRCDLSFIGTPRIRPLLEMALPIAQKLDLKLNIIGPNWDKYPGHPFAKECWIAEAIPYEEIPLLAKGSKICLVDHHESMNKLGSVSHKYVDTVMAGGFVISDENKDARRYYQGICVSSSQQLVNAVKRYISDPEARRAHVERQRGIMQTQTTRAAAEKIAEYFVD